MPDPPEPGADRVDGFSRRVFLERASLLGLTAALAQVPGGLAPRGLIAEADALELDVVHDTFNGLFAFALPGNDPYSTAQGERSDGPGGVASGGPDALTATLDRLVPASILGTLGVAIPLSLAVATLLNTFALQVNPAAGRGVFLSPFARLSFPEKGEVFRRLEAEALVSEVVEPLRYLAGLVPGFAAFLSFNEAGVYDARTRKLRDRPLGWRISGYSGPAEGHPGFRGYYQGRTAAEAPKR